MKTAFSMIELILAIVIIGVSIVAIPTIITQNTQSTAYALQQEAILQAETVMGSMLQKPWDKELTKITTAIKPILATNTSVKDLKTRAGLVVSTDIKNPRHIVDNSINANTIPITATTFPEAIEEYNDYGFQIDPPKRNSAQRLQNGDLIFQLRGKVWVNYMPDSLFRGSYLNSKDIGFVFSDTKSATTTNIKHITVSVKMNVTTFPSSVADADINLHAYVCNIGGNDIFATKLIPIPSP